MKKIRKIYFWFLSVALIYGGIFLRWIGTKNEYYDQNGQFREMVPVLVSGYEIYTLGTLGFMMLIVFSLFGWVRRYYWTPALLLSCFGLSVYLLGATTEYVDAHNRLRESLPFLAGGSGFFALGIGYFIFLVLFRCCMQLTSNRL